MPDQYGNVRSERKELVANIVNPYLKAKKDKTIQDQFKRVRPGSDGRIRSVLSIGNVETTRLSSSESFVDPSTTNLQNLSKKISFYPCQECDGDGCSHCSDWGGLEPLYQVRQCFVADQGYKLLACDYSKAEAIAAAILSHDTEYYDMLTSGEIDVHKFNASQFFNRPMEKITKPQRQVAKFIAYAVAYMAGPDKITRTFNKDVKINGFKLREEQVARLRRQYLDIHPLEDWWDRVDTKLKDQGYLDNLLGLRRWFLNPNDHKRLKEALSHQCQSSVATLINRALVRVDEEVDDDDEYQLLLQVHDEILGQAHTGLVEDKAKEVQDIMEEPFTWQGDTYHIPTEAEIGDNWGQLEEL